MFAPGAAAFARGFAAQQRGDVAQARSAYEETIAQDPAHIEARNNLAVILIQDRRYDETISICREIIDAAPHFAPAWANIAAALVELDMPRDAMPYAKRALELAPDNIYATNNLAVALLKCDRPKEAEYLFRLVLHDHPGTVGTMVDYGLALMAQDRTDEALGVFQSIMHSAHPKGALAKNNAAFIALSRGDYRNGWEWYKARFAATRTAQQKTHLPEWDGEPDPYGHLYVVAEGGVGDELLYLSMAQDLARRFIGTVTWELDARLKTLAERAYVARNLFFAPRLLVDTPPPDSAGLRIDAGRVGQYLRTCKADFPKAPWLPATKIRTMPRVGISWRSSNPVHGARKSIPLAAWEGFITTLTGAGISVMSLQYDEPDNLPAALVPCPFPRKKDIASQASLIANCEHVVTASNTAAHLAGAIGVPTTVLLSSGLGRFWYWGDGVTTDWYPSVTVNRFAVGTDMRPILDQIALDLVRKITQDSGVR